MNAVKLFFLSICSGVVLFSLLFCFTFSVSAGNLGSREVPPSFKLDVQDIDAVQMIQLPAVDMAEIQKQDMDSKRNGLPMRFAVPIDVDIDPWRNGTWEKLPDGTMLWRLRIFSKNASSLNFAFSPYYMPEGGKLYLYGKYKKLVQGPFTSADNKSYSQLWTPIVIGDMGILEMVLPEKSVPYLRLKLFRVNYGYKKFWLENNGKSGSCNVDVICPEGDAWRDEIRSVARISIDGTYLCTGSLINNVRQDDTPYFLTANHCDIDTSNDQSVVVYWNYETSTCNGTPDGSLSQNQTGVIYRASRTESDFCLVELEATPLPAYDVYYAGWDSTDHSITSGVCIHHPSGDEKRISHENDPITTTSYYNTSSPGDGTHLRVADWDSGTTEGGSSGSGLWDQNHHIVGQLHGGDAACGNDDSDWFGKFAVSWDAGTSASSRLKDWLDPDNTGTSSISGKDPGSTPTPGPSNTPTPIPQIVSLFLMDNDCSAGSTNFAGFCDPSGYGIIGSTGLCPTDCNPTDDCHIGWSYDSGDSGITWQYYITPVLTLDCTKNLAFDLCYGLDGWGSNLQGDFYVYWRCADGGATTDCSTMTSSGVSGDWNLAWTDAGVDWTTDCSSRTVTDQAITLPCSCDTVEIMIAVNFDAYADYYGIGYFNVYYDSQATQCSAGERTCPSAPTATPSPIPTFTPSPIPTFTPSPVPSSTPVPTHTPTPVPTHTPPPTYTPSPVPTHTPPPAPTFTPTPQPTNTPAPGALPATGSAGRIFLILCFGALLSLSVLKTRKHSV